MQSESAPPEQPGMQSGDADHVPTRSRWRPILGLVIVGVVVYFSLMAANTFGVALDLTRAEDTASSVRSAYAYRHTEDEPWRRGFGLTFAGWRGVAWASALTVGVVLALGGVWLRARAVRRTSLIALCAAAALWAANATTMAATADLGFFGPSVALHFTGFVGALVLLWSRWSTDDAAPRQS